MERQAQKIIKQHLSMDDCDIVPSYEDVRNKYGYTGYMNVYLRNSKNDQSMSSSADLNVVWNWRRLISLVVTKYPNSC